MLAAVFHQLRDPNVSLERARKLGVKPSDATGDPEPALSWLESNEEIFQVMGCMEEQMVTYSAFLLKDKAKDWWKALQRRHPKGVSWADFRREFSEKFYPKSYRDARVEEFFRLEQGSMSVADYERRFSELIRVVPYIADNEEEKANRFAVGLNLKIRAYVASAAHTQYGVLVEVATRVERSMAAILRTRPQKQSSFGSSQGGPSKSARIGDQPIWSSSQRSSAGPQSSQASVKPATGSSSTTENMRTRPLCSRYGRNHTGEGRQGITGCYICGQEGHFMKNYPQTEPASTSKPETRSTATGQTSGDRGQERGGFQFREPSISGQPNRGTSRSGPPMRQSGRPRTQARVFAVTQQEAEATLEVATVTITVFDRDAYVLIDLRLPTLLFPWVMLQMLV
ncbi:hypothetical protein JRO89_XS04G0158800 [Xanthoceras sorbifolium]|uniref:Retrotransposon gag domain-containing protein n=1 Tax=Xanthoceras sorbifolium TaxID=99658 RepID=A0ABQ8I5Y5_9ROSI|nr:hypothetical protein JRO89_XS04G0158800 [Xanthoceras sorbifolium]